MESASEFICPGCGGDNLKIEIGEPVECLDCGWKPTGEGWEGAEMP